MAVTWTEQDEQTNALATATKAAVANHAHRVTCILGSFDAAAVGKLLELKIGGTSKIKLRVHNSISIVFTDPIEAPLNTAVTLELAAGGEGIIGDVVLIGYTK